MRGWFGGRLSWRGVNNAQRRVNSRCALRVGVDKERRKQTQKERKKKRNTESRKMQREREREREEIKERSDRSGDEACLLSGV